jgi:hypothetical protein
MVVESCCTPWSLSLSVAYGASTLLTLIQIFQICQNNHRLQVRGHRGRQRWLWNGQ